MLTFPFPSTLLAIFFLVSDGLFDPILCSSALPIHDGALSLLSIRSYDDLQISGGVGGTALEEAARILQDPFRYVRYEDVPYSVYEHLSIMWEAIEYASIIGFPLALDAAQSQGHSAQALSIGRVKNDVLMRMAELQIYQIRQAKSRNQEQYEDDLEDNIDTYYHDLMVAVAMDRRNSGLVSQAIHLDYPL